MTELSYTVCGDYAIPNLKLNNPGDQPIGKYGRMRKRYLQEYRPILYHCRVLSETLYPHLLEIDKLSTPIFSQINKCITRTKSAKYSAEYMAS